MGLNTPLFTLTPLTYLSHKGCDLRDNKEVLQNQGPGNGMQVLHSMHFTIDFPTTYRMIPVLPKGAQRTQSQSITAEHHKVFKFPSVMQI